MTTYLLYLFTFFLGLICGVVLVGDCECEEDDDDNISG